MSDAIKYNVVAGGLDISKAMKSSASATQANRKMDRNDSTVWDQTVATCMEQCAIEGLVPPTNAKEQKESTDKVRKILAANMEKQIYNAGAIPETGKDREGKTIVLLNEKMNTIKWSSWEETRRIWAYLGDVAKVIVAGKGDLLYPESMKVAARCDILKQCKATAAPIEHVRRLAEQLQTYLDEMDTTDAIEAQGLVDTLMVNNIDPVQESAGHIRALDRIFTSLPASPEKETIKANVVSMGGKHFA